MMEGVAGNCNIVVMITSCMKGVAGNCKVVVMLKGSCGKLLQSDCSDVEKSLLNRKRNREFGSVSSQEQERFLSDRQNLHDEYLEREARRALQVKA